MSERIKFYTDEHVPSTVVAGLLSRGVDVLTTQKAKMLGATDREHLALAKNRGLMLIYHVLDTGDMQNHIEFL